MSELRSVDGSGRRGTRSVPETLVLTCVLAAISLVAILPVMCSYFFICKMKFGETGDWQVIAPSGLEHAHPLTAVTTICGGLAVAFGLAALTGLVVTVVRRLRRGDDRRLARLAGWAGILGLLFALVGVLHGMHVLAQEHPQAPLALGQGSDVTKLRVLLAVGGVALVLGVLPGLVIRRRQADSPAGAWILLAVAAVCTGMTITAFRTLTYWQHFIRWRGPQRPTDVSDGALLAMVGCVVALGMFAIAAFSGRRRRRRSPDPAPANGPGLRARTLHLIATFLVVFVVLVGLRLLTRFSPEDMSARDYVPGSFMASLSLAVLKSGDFGSALGVCLTLLALITVWSWLSRGRSVRPGRAAAWVGGIVVGVVLLAVAESLIDLVDKIDRLKSALSPRDWEGIPLANSVMLLGVPVFLAARGLAWTHVHTVRVAKSPSPSPWPGRIQRTGLAALLLGVAATGVSFWYRLFYEPTPTYLRWGAILWISGLTICAVLATASAVRDWYASIPTRRRRYDYRRKTRSASEKREQVGGVVQ